MDRFDTDERHARLANRPDVPTLPSAPVASPSCFSTAHINGAAHPTCIVRATATSGACALLRSAGFSVRLACITMPRSSLRSAQEYDRSIDSKGRDVSLGRSAVRASYEKDKWIVAPRGGPRALLQAAQQPTVHKISSSRAACHGVPGPSRGGRYMRTTRVRR